MTIPNQNRTLPDYVAPPDLLKDRVILVTGAGDGLGRALALGYAEHGATVILLGRTQRKLEAVYDEILARGYSEAVIFVMDLAKCSEVDAQALAEAVFKQLGRLDGIVHNAAHFDNLSPLEIQTIDQFQTMLHVNLLAPFALTRACLPLLKRAEDASVIFTSSSAGHTPSAYWGAHGISKHAAEHLAAIWALELEKVATLRINTVIPGALQSPQRRKSHPGEAVSALTPVESVLPAYLYLMGKAATGISGQIFQLG